MATPLSFADAVVEHLGRRIEGWNEAVGAFRRHRGQYLTVLVMVGYPSGCHWTSRPIAAGGIAFYDGLLGMGTGAFLVVAAAGLLGQNLRTSTAHAKFLNFASNAGSLAFFVLGGHVIWAAGLAMAIGQIIGARLGARAVLAKGAKLVRPLVVLAALAMAARLLMQQH